MEIGLDESRRWKLPSNFMAICKDRLLLCPTALKNKQTFNIFFREGDRFNPFIGNIYELSD